ATIHGTAITTDESGDGKAGGAANIARLSTNSDATVGTTQEFRVLVTDANSNPVSGQQVDFAKTAGNGAVSPASFATLANGQAPTTLTLGQTAGANTYTATIHGTAISTSVTVNGTVGAAASITTVSTNND